MGSGSSRDMLDPYAANTPLIGICVLSCLFNTVERGVFRSTNMFTNMFLFLILGCSTGVSARLQDPIFGAKLGLLGSAAFTAALPLKALYTGRMFSPMIHYTIGGGYMAYHSARWYHALHYFEDAREDADDESW